MLTLEKFEEASEKVKEVVLPTNLIYSEYFSAQTGNKVYLKPENMQYTGAYKVRGAYYKISTLSEEERKKGLITASAGNHAQGVAYAAKIYGVPATIVMPTTTPLIKVNRTKSYGAEVVLYGNVYDEACQYALKLAKEKDADLVLATDPDADRLGVYVKDTKTGEYITLTGNMSGCLIGEYELSQIKAKQGIPDDGIFVKTIVSTNMADAIAKYYNVRLIECLTGFKYIGQQILKTEQTGKGTYLFGFEESYGCLVGTHARDKDAIVATMALCEAAAYYKSKNMTLWDAMIEMYERYGYYRDDVKAITMKGIEGLQKIKGIMETLRKDAPQAIGDYKVLSARDYKEDTIKNLETGEITSTGLPASNVLYYDLNDDAWVCVRPSGTEPKIKLYYGVKGTSFEDAEKKSAELGAKVLEMIDAMM